MKYFYNALNKVISQLHIYELKVET